MFFTIKLYLHLNSVIMLNWIVYNRIICIKMDLALNNRQRLICHKTKTINQPLNIACVFHDPCGQSMWPNLIGGCTRGVMVIAMDCVIVISEFVLQSRYYVHFLLMLELWETQSTPSLPMLQGLLWPEVVTHDRVLSMGQIELFDI